MTPSRIIIDNPRRIHIQHIYSILPIAVESSRDIRVAGTTVGDIHTTFYRNKKSLRIRFYTYNKDYIDDTQSN